MQKNNINNNLNYNFYQCKPGNYTPEIVIEENKEHKADIMKGLQCCEAILNYQCKHHDDDKNEIENAEILCNALNTGDFKKWNEMHCMKQHHHFQYFLKPDCEDVTLFDLMECAIDSTVACLRRTGEEKTYEEEYKMFKDQGFDDFLAKVMANTFIRIQKLVKEDIK